MSAATSLPIHLSTSTSPSRDDDNINNDDEGEGLRSDMEDEKKPQLEPQSGLTSSNDTATSFRSSVPMSDTSPSLYCQMTTHTNNDNDNLPNSGHHNNNSNFPLTQLNNHSDAPPITVGGIHARPTLGTLGSGNSINNNNSDRDDGCSTSSSDNKNGGQMNGWSSTRLRFWWRTIFITLMMSSISLIIIALILGKTTISSLRQHQEDWSMAGAESLAATRLLQQVEKTENSNHALPLLIMQLINHILTNNP
jgi:hypothetical protein